jgi:uncharacterized membrane protein
VPIKTINLMPAATSHYLPLTLPFFLLLVGLLILLVAVIEIRVLEYTYARIGIRREYIFSILVVSLLGSLVNIPIAELPPEQIVSGREIVFFGMRYVVPVVERWPATVIAVNLGGAVVPIFLSGFLMIRNRLYKHALIGIVAVAVACKLIATPVPGLGIAIPVFVPSLITTFVALLLSRREAAPLAYICGSLGTLIGADLLNLHKVQGLGAPLVSIGGAGTFDGIFLIGIVSVLLASAIAPPRRSR